MFGISEEKARRRLQAEHETHKAFRDNCPFCATEILEELLDDSVEAHLECRQSRDYWRGCISNILRFKNITTTVEGKKFILVPLDYVSKLEKGLKDEQSSK